MVSVVKGVFGSLILTSSGITVVVVTITIVDSGAVAIVVSYCFVS